MSYIKVELDYPIEDGTQITFKAPAANTAVEGLKVYYPSVTDSAVTTTNKTFTFVDSANASFSTKNITAFATDSYVNVILDLTDSLAYVQNPTNNTVTQGLIDAVATLATTYATTDKAGIVKVGNGLNITDDGTLSTEVTKAVLDTSVNNLQTKIDDLEIQMPHQYIFTESGRFVKPKGLTTFNVIAIGGKGGDGFYNGTDDSRPEGGKGGTGDVVYKLLTLSEDEISIPFTIGMSGKDASNESDNDGNGGNGTGTTFGSYVTALGGEGGHCFKTSSNIYYGADGGDGGAGYYGGKGGKGGNVSWDSDATGGDGGKGGNGYYGGDGGAGGYNTKYSGHGGNGGDGGQGIIGGNGGVAGDTNANAGKNGSNGYNPTIYGKSAQNIPSFVTDLRTPAIYIWW